MAGVRFEDTELAELFAAWKIIVRSVAEPLRRIGVPDGRAYFIAASAVYSVLDVADETGMSISELKEWFADNEAYWQT